MMRLNSSGQSDLSSIRPSHSRVRPGRATTVASSVPLRDDFDAYTYASGPDPDEVYDDQRRRFVSYHRAEMGNMLGDGESALSHADGVEMEVYQHQPRHPPPAGARKVSGGRRIGDEGTMECVGRRYTATTGAGSRRAEGSRQLREQRYKLVERKILEDGPERTVSVWREEVAKSDCDHDDDDERELGREEEVQEERPLSDVDSHAHRRLELHRGLGLPYGALRPANTGSTGRMRSPSGGSQSAPWERAKMQSPHRTGASCTTLPSPPPSDPPSHSTGRPRTASRPRSRTPSYELHPPRAHSPFRPPTIPAHTPHPNNPSHLSHPTIPSHTSHMHAQHPPSSSPPPALTLPALLSTPTPPLTHLLPTLARLGITAPAHLAALARMGEDVRDREVRGVALAEGVSVFEWACLVDLGRGVEV